MKNKILEVLRISILAFFLVALASLIACGGRLHQIYGNWEFQGWGYYVKYEFRTDGTFTSIEGTINERSVAHELGYRIDGTFEISGNHLVAIDEGVPSPPIAFSINDDVLVLEWPNGFLQEFVRID